MIAQRDGSHTSASASACLSGRCDISVYGFIRRVTESSRIALLRAFGLHLTQRSVAGAARMMFLRDLVLQSRCFVWYTLRKHGGGNESGRPASRCNRGCALLSSEAICDGHDRR